MRYFLIVLIMLAKVVTAAPALYIVSEGSGIVLLEIPSVGASFSPTTVSFTGFAGFIFLAYFISASHCTISWAG